jgi:hypothetical protein
MILRQGAGALLVLLNTTDPTSIPENKVIPRRLNFCAEIAWPGYSSPITLKPHRQSRVAKKGIGACGRCPGANNQIRGLTFRHGARACANAFRVAPRFSLDGVVIFIASLLTDGEFSVLWRSAI